MNAARWSSVIAIAIGFDIVIEPQLKHRHGLIARPFLRHQHGFGPIAVYPFSN